MSVGVRMVSGWGLRVSGDLLIPKLFAKQIILGHDTQILSFLPVPGIA